MLPKSFRVHVNGPAAPLPAFPCSGFAAQADPTNGAATIQFGDNALQPIVLAAGDYRVFPCQDLSNYSAGLPPPLTTVAGTTASAPTGPYLNIICFI